MNSKIALIFGSFLVLAACSSPDDGSSNDGTNDEAEGALSTAGQKVVGSYVNEAGGKLRAIVLKSDGSFFADIDTGIRCVVAPCPSGERIEGTFTAGAKTVTLRAPDASDRASDVLGRFRYAKTEENLSLTKSGETTALKSVATYCAQASDCYGQGQVLPACFPLSFTCTEEATCSFHCGNPPPLDPCRGLDEEACLDRPTLCRREMGPSSCTPGPNPRCTRDFVFKGCTKR